MDILEKFLQNNNLNDAGDMDALLDCATVVRQLISEKRYADICRVVRYTIQNSFFEAFLWTIGILQEEFEKESCVLEDFCCDMGSCIASYDDFVQSLQVDFNALKNEIEKIYDENGEVCAFFNTMIYKTDFENVFFISSENFDNKDNDFIQYRLSFVRDKNIYSL